MAIELWVVGKTSFSYLQEGIDIYQKRLKRYVNFNFVCFPDIKNAKNLSEEQLKEKEGQVVLKKIQTPDTLFLLDEKGKFYSSIQFAEFIEKQLVHRQKRLIFVIGGAYGFSDAIYNRANGKISLSSMTFSHQMVRLFAIEQLYRAMTILRNEPYHHR